METNKILDFVKRMKTREPVIFFYSKPEDKRLVLFTYLRAGLDAGEAAIYVASQESVDEVREQMRRFGVSVDRLERSGDLKVIDYRDWYIIDGRFDQAKTTKLWKDSLDTAMARGCKGLRVVGEAWCFFKNNMIKELVEYEKSLHGSLDIPLNAICAYDSEAFPEQGGLDLIFDLVAAHSTVIFTGTREGLVKTATTDKVG
jgi:hypothetical protein